MQGLDQRMAGIAIAAHGRVDELPALVLTGQRRLGLAAGSWGLLGLAEGLETRWTGTMIRPVETRIGAGRSASADSGYNGASV